MTRLYQTACVCVRRDGPEGCGICNETGRRETADLSLLTHEELAAIIGNLELIARSKWENLTPVLTSGGFLTIEIDEEPTIEQRRNLATSIAPVVEGLGLRVLVIGPHMKARESHRCESCGKAKK